ncbi:MAG: hypothetical protein AAFR38_10840 [Planctomycetota bacterium]
MKLPENPRRVRGGVKLQLKEDETAGWITQRFMRIVESAASGESLREGLEYARGGQTRKLEFVDGQAEASVQGRRPRAYVTRLALKPFTPEEREKVVEAMGRQAKYAAKLLARELPQNIEDAFGPLGLRLFPAEPSDFILTCSCKEENKPWCKHVVCVAALVAEKLQSDPLMLFDLRGLAGAELIERLREQRALAGQGPGESPVHQALVPGVTDAQPAPIDADLESFWSAGPELEDMVLPLERPEVASPLLRRLGPSPFTEGRFPLVGLLATCYELIGDDAIGRAESAGPNGEGGEIDPEDA